MAVQHVTCSECGREGQVEARAANLRVVLDIMLGLDPVACAGCRAALESNGYAVTGVRFNSDGTVHFTEVEDDTEEDRSTMG